MARFDMAAQMQAAEDAGLTGGGGFYKYREGENRFRLLSECLPHQNSFQGQKSFKWLCYVLDRRTASVKAHFMPHTIYKAIAALQTDQDYAFQDVPMPYDVVVRAKGAGTKDVEYTLIPRKETQLTAEEREDIARQKPIKELQDAIKAKQQPQPQEPHAAAYEPQYEGDGPDVHGDELTADRVPF